LGLECHGGAECNIAVSRLRGGAVIDFAAAVPPNHDTS
jgi:hypothetical protein